jgi:hypothetical protein
VKTLMSPDVRVIRLRFFLAESTDAGILPA